MTSAENRRLWTLPLLALLLLCGGCGSDDYLMERLFVDDDGTWRWQGQSCGILDGRSSSGQGVSNDTLEEGEFSIVTEVKRGTATVTITTSEESQTLHFDRDFIRSGEVEVTEFETGDGTKYRLEHHGGNECEMEDIEIGAGGVPE